MTWPTTRCGSSCAPPGSTSKRCDENPGVPREGPGAPDADARGERRAEGLALGELRDHAPSIADIRLAASLEFLHAIDYDFPAWASEYMTAMEEALGEAYSEPAADVRGFVASVK